MSDLDRQVKTKKALPNQIYVHQKKGKHTYIYIHTHTHITLINIAYIPDSGFFLVCAQESDVATLEKDSLRPRGWEAEEFACSDGTIADPIEVTLWAIGPTEEEEEVFFFLLLDLFFSRLFPCSLDDFLPSSRDLFGDYLNYIPFSICFVKENFQEQCGKFETKKMILTCSLFDVAFSRETMRKPLNMLEFLYMHKDVSVWTFIA